MQCVILSGGLGLRMRQHSGAQPKHLIAVGGRPFADYQLRWLSTHGVDKVVYSIGYQGDRIRGYVGDGRQWNLDVRYVDEGSHLRGTAGALRLAADAGALSESFALIYGDSFLPIDLRSVEQDFNDRGYPAMMTVFRNDHRFDRGNVIYDGQKVVLYDKKPDHPRQLDMTYIDYGLSFLQRDAIAARIPPQTVVDLGSVFRDLSEQGLLAGHLVSERFYEVGSPEGLRDFGDWLHHEGATWAARV